MQLKAIVVIIISDKRRSPFVVWATRGWGQGKSRAAQRVPSVAGGRRILIGKVFHTKIMLTTRQSVDRFRLLWVKLLAIVTDPEMPG